MRIKIFSSFCGENHAKKSMEALITPYLNINYGDFNGYDEFGNSIGKFTGNETSVGISSSHYFLKTNLYLGAKLKFILSHLDIYSSSAIATDIGVFYESLKNDVCFSILFISTIFK